MGTTFDSIARGLNEAVAHAKGKKVAVKNIQAGSGGCIRIASAHGHDARAICRTVWISVATLRYWERRNRTPQGASLLLNVIKRARCG